VKRSEINVLIDEATLLFKKYNFLLPPFAYWTPEEWEAKGTQVDEIRECMLGWDVTDFGSNDFQSMGLLLFTLRNGSCNDRRYPKPYGEKILIVDEGQVTPMHFHWSKIEDIINRGGGNLILKLYNATADEGLADTTVSVTVDGCLCTVPAGEDIIIHPGESICLTSGLYHTFWGEPGSGKVLVGEVSCVNDDTTDNRFLEPIGRFPQIEEDEPPRNLLVGEYPVPVKSC
jgi:D-lyxose ketol-isomerase